VVLGFLGIDPSFHWALFLIRRADLKQMEGDRLRYIFGRFWRRSISHWATWFVRGDGSGLPGFGRSRRIRVEVFGDFEVDRSRTGLSG
jgi:hypothetical protein